MTETTSAKRRALLTPTDLALIASFAALIVAAARVSFPIGAGAVPITLQVFAVILAGASLGAVRGALAVGLYLIIGLAGVPVFASVPPGPSAFTTIAGGYLLSFVVAAFVVGLVVEQAKKRFGTITLGAVLTAGLVGEVVITLGGAIAWAIIVDISYHSAVWAAMVFVPADLVKITLAAFAAAAVHRAFPQLIPGRIDQP